MPIQRRDNKTGALIFSQTGNEKQTIEMKREIKVLREQNEILNQKLDQILNVIGGKSCPNSELIR